MYSLDVSPAMRVVQMAGPALDRCNVGGYNCAYAPLQDQFAFAELLYVLMQGTGMGFSVEDDYVSQLPRVKKQNGKKETIVCDDTTESWCDTYYKHLQLLWDGWDTHVDVTRVRKKGTRLKTKGGRASGPGPFLDLIAFSRNVIKSRQGRFLEDTDAHRLGCFTGRIVQVGGVRRAAENSLSDLESVGMRTIKSGAWWSAGAGLWEDGDYLSMANNSAVYGEDTPIEVFMEEWLALTKSKAGERGIFNRHAANKYKPARRKSWKFGANPCFEIILRAFQFCNLTIVIARPRDTRETLLCKVRLAAYFGKIQSMMTEFGYIRKDWKENCVEERLLGVDVTGHADCPLLHYGAPGRAELLREFKQVVADVDRVLSARWGVNLSAANTTIKPGGDSAVLFNCGSGVSDWFDQYTIRWVRETSDSPVAGFLRDSGVPYADDPRKPGLQVFGFPRKAPDGSTVVGSKTAIQQLENWLEWRMNFAEHSVSASIYVKDYEWMEVGAWVYKNLDKITGVSFFPFDNGSYTYAPNERITPQQYDEMVAAFPALDWSKLTRYETSDQTTTSGQFACVGGQCD
jgi:ribonucleoside-triphosphate reductase (thioredoxin)